jgi:hypothetical protein
METITSEQQAVKYTGAEGRCMAATLQTPWGLSEPPDSRLHPGENLVRRAESIDRGEFFLLVVVVE